jgi:hypothetical protein
VADFRVLRGRVGPGQYQSPAVIIEWVSHYSAVGRVAQRPLASGINHVLHFGRSIGFEALVTLVQLMRVQTLGLVVLAVLRQLHRSSSRKIMMSLRHSASCCNDYNQLLTNFRWYTMTSNMSATAGMLSSFARRTTV